jgi:hypothetical protein
LSLRTAARIVARMDQNPETVGPATAGGLPPGYREGFLTAITVILGFSLALVRFWGLESSGPWTTAEVVSTAVVGVPIVMLGVFAAIVASAQTPDQQPEPNRAASTE